MIGNISREGGDKMMVICIPVHQHYIGLCQIPFHTEVGTHMGSNTLKKATTQPQTIELSPIGISSRVKCYMSGIKVPYQV